MKLEDFFRTVAPFLEGRMEHAEAARALYGSLEGGAGGGPKDVERLAIYGRFCRAHRYEILEGLYPYCRGVVMRQAGEAAWEALVDTYFQRHPMKHSELNANGGQVPEYLEGYVQEAGLPEWLVALADFEWWEWQTLVAPEDEAGGPRPRISAAVELRPYGWDIPGWLETEEGERPEAPEARECLVLFWRDGENRLRRAEAGPLELRVLKALSEDQPLEESLQETLAELVEAHVVLGA